MEIQTNEDTTRIKRDIRIFLGDIKLVKEDAAKKVIMEDLFEYYIANELHKFKFWKALTEALRGKIFNFHNDLGAEWSAPIEFYKRVFGIPTVSDINKVLRDINMNTMIFCITSRKKEIYETKVRPLLLEGDSANGIPYLPQEMVDMIFRFVPKKVYYSVYQMEQDIPTNLQFICGNKMYNIYPIQPSAHLGLGSKTNGKCNYRNTNGKCCQNKPWRPDGERTSVMSGGCRLHSNLNARDMHTSMLKNI